MSKQLFRKWKIKIYDLMFHIMFMGVGSVYPTCVIIKNWCRKHTNPVQRDMKFNFDHKIWIYRRDWVKWIGNVIRIHLYTFKIIDKHNSCLHGCVMCWQFLSVPPPTLKLLTKIRYLFKKNSCGIPSWIITSEYILNLFCMKTRTFFVSLNVRDIIVLKY